MMARTVVLVVDYHTDSRIVYSTALQSGGFAVLEAQNGADALAMVAKHRPDMIITELCLPVIDGCEVLERLRRHPRTSHIPVLIVTAEVDPELERRAMDGGCNAYLRKPCTPSELLVAVRSVLDQAVVPALA